MKIILLELSLLLSAPAANKTQYFVHVSFNSILKLINSILGDLQKLLRYFNDTAIVSFFRIPFNSLAFVFPNNLALYSKELKLLLAISASKLVASFLE